MQKYTHIFFLTLAVLACSCSVPQNNCSVYSIETLRAGGEYFDWAGFPAQISYIPLEFNKECPVGYVAKIIPAGEYIFVQGNDLYQFDRNGRFIRKIGSKGQGPGEYIQLADVSVDENTGKIFLAELTGKVSVFDFDGRYLAEYKNTRFWRRVEAVDDRYLLAAPLNMFGNAEDKLLLVTFAGDTITRFRNDIRFSADFNDIFMIHDFMTFGRLSDGYLFRQQFNDTIYTFRDDAKTLSVRYYFDFAGQHLPSAALESHTKFTQGSPDYGYVNDIAETDTHIFVTIVFRGNNERYVIEKASGKSFRTKSDDTGMLWPDWQYGSVYVDCLTAETLIKHKDKITDKRLREVTDRLTEESNPVVALITM